MNVIERAKVREAEAVQIFPSNSRRWQPYRYSLEEMSAFRRGLREADLPLYVHAIYLINLAAPDPEVRRSSAAALAYALYFGALTGAAGVVCHVGSHKGQGFEIGLERVVRSVAEAEELAWSSLQRAEASPEGSALASDGLPRLPNLLLESSAGSKNTLGRNVEELALLVGALDYPTGVCLDTAHVYAAGIPVHTEEGLADWLTEVESHIGWARLGLVHLNDCRTAFGSLHDQHADIGDGNLGEEGLGRIVRHAQLVRVPFILEVPGVDDQGPDLVNVRRARSLRSGATLEAAGEADSLARPAP